MSPYQVFGEGLSDSKEQCSVCSAALRDLQTELLGLLDLNSTLPALRNVLRLDAHDTSTPAAAILRVVVELSAEVVSQGLEILLPAQGREPANKFDRVNVVGDHDKLGSLVLDEGGHVVEAVLDDSWLLGLGVLAILLGLGQLHEARFLRFLGLGHVLLAEAQELRCLVLVNRHVKLIDRWRDLQTHEHDALHSLKADVLRPSHETSQVALWLDVSTEAVVARRDLTRFVRWPKY